MLLGAVLIVSAVRDPLWPSTAALPFAVFAAEASVGLTGKTSLLNGWAYVVKFHAQDLGVVSEVDIGGEIPNFRRSATAQIRKSTAPP